MSALVIEPLLVIELFHSFWLEELNGADVGQCGCTALFAIVLGDNTFLSLKLGMGIAVSLLQLRMSNRSIF